MPLITTPGGLRYYRFSDRTKRIWQYRLENGNWVRLSKPIRISEGHDDQYTFGISHFSDLLKEPVVTVLAGSRNESMLEFQWAIDDNYASQVAVPDSVRKLTSGNISPVLLDPSPALDAPPSLWGKQWAFLAGGSNKFSPVELELDVYLQVSDEAGIIIDTALAAASWNEEPRVFVLTRQKDSPVRHVQECVYDADEKGMTLRQLTKYDGWVGVGIDGQNVVVAYEDRDEYGINLKTLVWDEEEEWCDGPDIDRWEGANGGSLREMEE
ncbi:hypothetical protein MKX07_005751 [Trichoderma sp. CBMAI-0711]|nr:hypothetical protein MKX07_005751 [Trichoderma sp. CBMAI-0711]